MGLQAMNSLHELPEKTTLHDSDFECPWRTSPTYFLHPHAKALSRPHPAQDKSAANATALTLGWVGRATLRAFGAFGAFGADALVTPVAIPVPIARQAPRRSPAPAVGVFVRVSGRVYNVNSGAVAPRARSEGQ